MAILTNNKNNTIIDSDRIVYESDKGIVVTNKKAWRYIPNENISSQEEYQDGYYYNQEGAAVLNKATRTEEYNLAENIINTNYIEKSSYIFGLASVELANVNIHDVSGITSDYIELGSYNYITISHSIENVEDYTDYSVEYSILDGTIEFPIVPETENHVFEKLFFNTSTRFSIDMVTDTPLLYQYNKLDKSISVVENKSYTELTVEDYNNYDYYLYYKPGGEYHKYIPENSNIRLKIILRNLNKDGTFCILKSVIINKYGGAVEWN